MDFKLLLIDGHNLVHRVFRANTEEDPEVLYESALRSTFGSFRRAINTHQPTHGLVVFDEPGPDWRNTLYPEYHAERGPVDPVFTRVLEAIKPRIRDELGLPMTSKPGYEADDILAMVGRKWVANNLGRAVILTTDKDMCQLLTDGVELYDHFKDEVRDIAWVRNKFGVEPHQLGDFLAMAGDKTDGIPGIPGIGPKKASDLLAEHGDLQGILNNVASIPGKMGSKIAEHAEQVTLFRQLVDFRTDMDLGLSVSALRL